MDNIRKLHTNAINLLSLIPHLQYLLPLKHPNSSLQSPFGQSPPIYKMFHQPPIIRTKPDRDTFLNLLLDLCNLIIHILANRRPTVIYRVHGTGAEKSDGLIDMVLRDDGRKRDFGKGFGDTDDGFELADCDGDAGTFVGVLFDLVDLFADFDKVGGKLLRGFVVEARGATGFGEADVRAHFVDGDFPFGTIRNGSVDVNVQHVLCHSLLLAKIQVLGLSTLSRAASWVSLTIKIKSKRERIVV